MALFDFEKKIADSLNIDFSDFMKLGHYRYLRAILKDRWLILKKNNTYPYMIKPLIIKQIARNKLFTNDDNWLIQFF